MVREEQEFYKLEGIEIIGNFANGYGEQYCVYRFRHAPGAVYITGDELDWEFGWQFIDGSMKLTKEFVLSQDEYKRLLGLVKKK